MSSSVCALIEKGTSEQRGLALGRGDDDVLLVLRRGRRRLVLRQGRARQRQREDRGGAAESGAVAERLRWLIMISPFWFAGGENNACERGANSAASGETVTCMLRRAMLQPQRNKNLASRSR